MQLIQRGLVVGVAALLLTTAACSDDDKDGDAKGERDAAAEEAVAEEEAEAREGLELPVPPIEEAPSADPCDLFTGLAGESAILEALGSDIDDTQIAPWTGADTSWTASCVISGQGGGDSASATVSLTLSSAAVPEGPDEVEGLEGGHLDPDLSVVTWAHEGLNLSLRVNHLPRDDAAATADNEAVVTLATALDENL